MGKTFNKTGRSGQFFPVPHFVCKTHAWKRLSVTARSAWLEFGLTWNGFNNGKIAMSSRTLGKKLGVSKDTANRAIKDLVTFGFLEKTKAASFISKRRAAEYRLTHIKEDITGELPSRTFQNMGKVDPGNGNGLASEEKSSTSFNVPPSQSYHRRI